MTDSTAMWDQWLSASPKDLAPYGYVLQDLVNTYPYFSLGHKLLFQALCGLGGEAYMAVLEKAALYVPSRARLYAIYEESRKQEAVLREKEALDSLQALDRLPLPQEEKVRVAGADYFSKSDYRSLDMDPARPLDRFIADRPKLSPAGEDTQAPAPAASEDFRPEAEESFITETLADIYAKQGYYKLAITCYEKLILLYPKKSTYFATLIDELKKL